MLRPSTVDFESLPFEGGICNNSDCLMTSTAFPTMFENISGNV